MAHFGPESSPPPPPPPPKAPVAPPMTKMAAPKKKEDSLLPQTQQKIESLNQINKELLERIAAGDKKAEEEYDMLKKELTDKLGEFNKSVVSVIDAKVKALEETLEEQTAILTQETSSAKSRIIEIERQFSVLENQKGTFSKLKTSEALQLVKEIENTLKALSLNKDAINMYIEQQLPLLEGKKEATQALLKQAKLEQVEARKTREQLTAISQALPVRVKTKETPVAKPVIDFKHWVENGLLGGVYLQKLKDFIQVTTDAETIAKLTAITNPERKMFKPLSLNVILAIASGYITLTQGKSFNETTPLKDATIDSSKKWLLELLIDAFYQANPALKENAEQDKTAFFNTFVSDLDKLIQAAAPKATPVHAPAAPAASTHVQLPAFALKKARELPAPALKKNNEQKTAINPGQALLKKAVLPATPVVVKVK